MRAGAFGWAAALAVAGCAAHDPFVGPATAGTAFEPVDCHDGTFCRDPAFPQCPGVVPPGKPRPPCEAASAGGDENAAGDPGAL